MIKEISQIDIKAHVDDRGVLWQIFDQEIKIKRIYVIRNHKAGIIRGFHLHNKETKIYFIAKGAAKFITTYEVPPTYEDPDQYPRDHYSELQSYILSDKNPSIIIIPPGHLHGWVSLIDNTILIGMSDKTLAESKEDDYRINPNRFGMDTWSIIPR